MKVLIVDDSKFSRVTFKNMLEELSDDIEILQGANGVEAVSLYKENSPDILFLDLTMPVMSGFEALDKIISYDPEAIVIIVSADIQTKAKEQVKKSGAKLMIQKPIDSETLRAILEDFGNEK